MISRSPTRNALSSCGGELPPDRCQPVPPRRSRARPLIMRRARSGIRQARSSFAPLHPTAVLLVGAQMVASVLLMGCGGSSPASRSGTVTLASAGTSSGSTTHEATSTSPPPVTTQSKATKPSDAVRRAEAATPKTVASHPGCGQYCAQAGVGQADVPPGYPCPAGTQAHPTGCFNCPPHHCMALLTSSAFVNEGTFVVRLGCNLSKPCVGAVLLCAPTELCGVLPGVPPGYGGRIAASDFVIPAHSQSAIAVSLTPLGRSHVTSAGGYRGDVLLDLENYGDIAVSIPPAEPPAYDPRSLACRSASECSYAASIELKS